MIDVLNVDLGGNNTRLTVIWKAQNGIADCALFDLKLVHDTRLSMRNLRLLYTSTDFRVFWEFSVNFLYSVRGGDEKTLVGSRQHAKCFDFKQILISTWFSTVKSAFLFMALLISLTSSLYIHISNSPNNKSLFFHLCVFSFALLYLK